MNQEKFNYFINRFEEESINIHYLGIKTKDDIFIHQFKKQATKSDCRSLSKTVLSLITGIIINNSEVLNIDTKVWPTIKNVTTLKNMDNLPYLEQLEIKHLMNHTIGFDQVLMMRQDIKDKNPFTLIDTIINTPIIYKPGEHYLYSNAGYYLLSVFLQEYYQEDLLQVSDQLFFKPLGIKDYTWEKYGNYLAGATRLWLKPEDLIKIGDELINKTLITQDWLDYLTTLSAVTLKVYYQENTIFNRYGYGNGLWLNDKGHYFGHGTGGQSLGVLEKEKAIVITMADQRNVRVLESIVNEIFETLLSKQIKE